MIKKWFVISYLLVQCIFAQKNTYPTDFGLPMETPVALSANFGELRNNHFHSGIDLKTLEQEGLKVHSVADGYVSRIKISHYGYGKALYITHPNGYTTVYGHLKEFSPKIEAIVKQQQYAKKTFEVELFPKASELSVSKGELIALSGNTGGSGGPHLHFEYRDTKTEHIINPFCFGIDKEVKDSRKPAIIKVFGYPLDDNSTINQSENRIEIQLKQKGDGSYIAQTVEAKGKVGFGIDSYDLTDENWNRKGLYHVQSILNGDPLFEYKFDTFSFDESRYINAFIDYQHYIESKDRIQKLFIDNTNKLSVIKNKPNNGHIEIKPNLNYTNTLLIKDYHGNTTEVTIPIVFSDKKAVITKQKSKTGYLIQSAIDNSLSQEYVSVFMPTDCFYSDFYFDFEVKNGIAKIHHNQVPVHKNITITFDITSKTKEERKGLFIASLESNKWTYNTSKIKGNKISVNVKLLGDYKLDYDTTPPIISKLSFQKSEVLTNNSKISVTIIDTQSGIDSYFATVNDQWILMEYDYKTDLLSGNLSDITLSKGSHQFKIIVTDKLGNTSELQMPFIIN